MPNKIDYKTAKSLADKQESQKEFENTRDYYTAADNRIDRKFAELATNYKKALITFITGGHYGFDTTEKLVEAMVTAGADIIEIGVPFSDPVAEGPVIQQSSAEALSHGASLEGIFECVEKIRFKQSIPLVLMIYANSIFAYGKEIFFEKCRICGIDGVIVPDLPLEEYDEIHQYALKYNVHAIRLAAPTSEPRLRQIADGAKGFLYCVSSTGVTGMRSEFKTDFSHFFSAINRYCKIPTAIGFGISTPQQAKEMSQYAEGVIVGSAIVKLVSEYGKDSIDKVYEFTKALSEAVKN